MVQLHAELLHDCIDVDAREFLRLDDHVLRVLEALEVRYASNVSTTLPLTSHLRMPITLLLVFIESLQIRKLVVVEFALHTSIRSAFRCL